MSTIAQTATLAHGFTMADIDKMARHVGRFRHSTLIDPEESQAIAWAAIVEALYAAQTAPTWYELADIGKAALRRERESVISFCGLNTHSKNGWLNDQKAPSFSKYWGGRHDAPTDFTDRLTERLALPAVLGILSPRQYEAISTLAAFDGDMKAAANAIGVTTRALQERVQGARKAVLAVWFEHETPRSRGQGEPGKCRNGHSRDEHSVVDKNGKTRCLVCHASNARRASRRHYQRQKDAARDAEAAS